eukprot:1650969-Pyramimonas_sp.AAC.1
MSSNVFCPLGAFDWRVACVLPGSAPIDGKCARRGRLGNEDRSSASPLMTRLHAQWMAVSRPRCRRRAWL